MIFLDASTIVAILAGEPEAEQFMQLLQEDEVVTSPLALFEAALGVSRKTNGSLEEAYEDLQDFLALANIGQVPIQPADFLTALDAARRFGKGRGHPARLNLGDCFAYASARNANAKLLFKGDDFSQTDIVSASS